MTWSKAHLKIRRVVRNLIRYVMADDRSDSKREESCGILPSSTIDCLASSDGNTWGGYYFL